MTRGATSGHGGTRSVPTWFPPEGMDDADVDALRAAGLSDCDVVDANRVTGSMG